MRKAKIVIFHWHVVKIILSITTIFSRYIILLRVKGRLPLVDTFNGSFALDKKYKQDVQSFGFFCSSHNIRTLFSCQGIYYDKV